MLHVHFVDFTKICEKKTPKNSSKPNFTKNLKKLKKNFWLALFRKKFVNSIHVVDDYFLASKILLSDFTKIFSFWKFLCLFQGFFSNFFFVKWTKCTCSVANVVGQFPNLLHVFFRPPFPTVSTNELVCKLLIICTLLQQKGQTSFQNIMAWCLHIFFILTTSMYMILA